MLPLYDASEDGHRGGACVSVIVQLVSPVHVSARTLAKVATAALSFRRHSPTTGQASTCGPHVAPGTAPMLSVSRLRGWRKWAHDTVLDRALRVPNEMLLLLYDRQPVVTE